MFARRAFASEHFENVSSFAQFARACGSCGNSKRVCQADQFIPNDSGGQCCRPAEQERGAAGSLEKVLFLPAMMITQKIAVVGKKTDKNVVRVRPCFDRIKDAAKTMIE